MTSANIPALLAQASAHLRAGRLKYAEPLAREVLAADANNVDALHMLGFIATQLGQLDTAIALLTEAIRLKPKMAGALATLANAHFGKGRLDLAIATASQALDANPNYVDALCVLGVALARSDQPEPAITALNRAIQLQPNNIHAYKLLGFAYSMRWDFDNAIAAYNQGLAVAEKIMPDPPVLAELHNAVGCAYREKGDIERAIIEMRKSVELQPNHSRAHSNLLFAMHFSPATDAVELFKEHQRWNERHAAPLAAEIQPHTNERNPDRRLRIGYVSSDFCYHSAGRFLLTLLPRHDHAAFEIFCYAHVLRPDSFTEKFKAVADGWRNIVSMPEQQLADLIRQDRIDILVDLTMHTEKSNLLAFARKPAPIQITYLAYVGTTGLSTIDYRLSDPWLDPPGADETVYTEMTFRLPETYWCYEPPEGMPDSSPLPALSSDHITFGSLNSFAKVNDVVLTHWTRVLNAVPNSRLLLSCSEGAHRQRVLKIFADHGLPSSALEFAPRVSLRDYFKLYHRIDIALDPFPYGGGTTTCDALWMGVPVITLIGKTGMSRAGLSIVSNAGYPEFAATTPAEYIEKIKNMAADLPSLAHLRSTLRQRMSATPLCDASRFVRTIETTYRTLWQNWCNKRNG